MNKQIFLLILMILSMGFLFIPMHPALVFYKENTKTIDAYVPINKNESFEIVYTHSIHLTDVVERYFITPDFLIQQYEMEFEEFGIGMPSYALGNEEFVIKDGKYQICNMENIFSSLSIRLGTIYPEQQLVWGDSAEYHIWFIDYFEPGSWITVQPDYLSVWQWLRGEQINEYE